MNADYINDRRTCSICGHKARIEIEGPEPLRLCRECLEGIRELSKIIGPIEGKNAGTKGR